MGFLSKALGIGKKVFGVANKVLGSPLGGAAVGYLADKQTAAIHSQLSRESLAETKRANIANEKLQREFAQQGIQWKVQDAKHAGIHPLAALGAVTPSPSIPVIPSQPTGGSVEKSMAHRVLAYRREIMNNELLETQKKSVEADITLKMAEASKIAREAQAIGATKPMWEKVYDNNPNSPTHGKEVYVPMGEWAENTESGMGFWGTIYQNLMGNPNAVKGKGRKKPKGKLQPRKNTGNIKSRSKRGHGAKRR